MILVDSSAWIEFLRATGSPQHHRLRAALGAGEALATTGIVLLEVLAGARDERHAQQLQRLFDPCAFVPLEEPSDEEDAAAIYRTCRRRGETIRSVSECLIASVAIRMGADLLHRDADFDAIARHLPLTVVAV